MVEGEWREPSGGEPARLGGIASRMDVDLVCRDERVIRHGHDPAPRVAVGRAEGIELLEVSDLRACLLEEFTSRRHVEPLVLEHEAARDRP